MRLERTHVTGHVYGREDFSWRQQNDVWRLHCHGYAVLSVVPDDRYSGMWRVQHRSGRLSDMANLTWAKDGAIAIAMRMLSQRSKGEESAVGAPPMRLGAGDLPRPPRNAKRTAALLGA